MEIQKSVQVHYILFCWNVKFRTDKIGYNYMLSTECAFIIGIFIELNQTSIQSPFVRFENALYLISLVSLFTK